jgi:hypothetical protein
MSNSFRAGAGQALIMLAAAVAALVLAYTVGRAHERLSCEAVQSKAQLKSQGQVITQAGADIKRASRIGRAREADSAHVDAFFNRLAEEARHVPTDPVDSCVLPDERLRLWADANAGAFDPGATASERDSAASAPAAAELWPDARLGGQPPGGGQGLSPARQPALPAAAAPGDSPR